MSILRPLSREVFHRIGVLRCHRLFAPVEPNKTSPACNTHRVKSMLQKLQAHEANDVTNTMIICPDDLYQSSKIHHCPKNRYFPGFVINGNVSMKELVDFYCMKVNSFNHDWTVGECLCRTLHNCPLVGDCIKLDGVDLTILAVAGIRVEKIGLTFRAATVQPQKNSEACNETHAAPRVVVKHLADTTYAKVDFGTVPKERSHLYA